MDKIKKRFRGLKLNVKFTVIIAVFVLIPILALSAWIFRTMERNVVREKENAMRYKLGKDYDLILKNVDSINMTTQFFLSDQGLADYLISARSGNPYGTEELLEFYGTQIASLERMVNTNPYLYQVRVYTDAPDAREMMPVLYGARRMEKLAWAPEEPCGWKFDYEDTIFDGRLLEREKKIMALVTPMEVYGEGRIGILEVAMRMDVMFPSLYDGEAGNYSCFADEKGNLYFGGEAPEWIKRTAAGLLSEYGGGEGQRAVFLEEGDGGFMAGICPVRELGGTLLGIEDLGTDLEKIRRQRNLFALMGVFVMGLLVAGVNLTVKRLLKQFYVILNSVRKVQKGGDLNMLIEDCGEGEMGELSSQMNKMMARIRQLMEDNVNHERLVKNTEIRALQNQINAHFIYNVLESVKMMAEVEEKYEISDAITSLGKLLRYSMRWTSGNVTVGEELEYIKNYLALINLRNDYEIYLSLNIPEAALRQEIPKMSLQPIVENAIYHGIEQMAEDTNIYIKGVLDGKDCVIEITDAGRGMSGEELDALNRKLAGGVETSGGGNGIGLKNVQDRLKMSFGENYGLEISSRQGCYTKVRVRVPKRYL